VTAAVNQLDYDSLPFRRLLSREHTSDEGQEDRTADTTNPTLTAAVNRLDDDSLPFRHLLGKPGCYYTDKAQKEQSPMAATPSNPALEAAYKRFDVSAKCRICFASKLCQSWLCLCCMSCCW
jgi:hypothetical protein